LNISREGDSTTSLGSLSGVYPPTATGELPASLLRAEGLQALQIGLTDLS